MKKYLFVLLLILVTFSMMSFKSKDKSTNVLFKNESVFKASVSASINYDNNDHISEAINITPNDYFKNQSFSKVITDNVNTFGGVIDMDFYYIKIVRESNIKLSFNIVGDTSAEVYLQGVDSYIESKSLRFQLFDNYYDLSSKKVKQYTGKINPGTYYISIRGKSSDKINEGIAYTLDLTVEDIYVNKGLIDLSNVIDDKTILLYTGLNYNHLFNLNPVMYEQRLFIKKNYVLDSLLLDLLNFRKSENIAIGSLFIVNNELRRYLSDVFLKLSSEIIINIKSKLNSINDINLTKEVYENTKEIFLELNILDVVKFKDKVSLGLEVVDLVIDLVKKILYDSLKLEEIDISNIYSYYAGVLKANKIIEFPIYLQINGDYIDYCTNIFEIIDNFDHEYTKFNYKLNLDNNVRCYNCYNNENNQCDKCSNITSIFNGTYSVINDKDYESFDLNNFKPKYFYETKYIEDDHIHNMYCTYYDGKYHTKSCYCGYEIREPHVVNRNNPTRCIDCGGKVDKGFIVGTYRQLRYVKTNDIYLSKLL